MANTMKKGSRNEKSHHPPSLSGIGIGLKSGLVLEAGQVDVGSWNRFRACNNELMGCT